VLAGSSELVGLQLHSIRAPVQATEVFTVTYPELEEGGYVLTIGWLQAFKF
jgi:hypothetical protein